MFKMVWEPGEVNKVMSCQGYKNLDSQGDVEWKIAS